MKCRAAQDRGQLASPASRPLRFVGAKDVLEGRNVIQPFVYAAANATTFGENGHDPFAGCLRLWLEARKSIPTVRTGWNRMSTWDRSTTVPTLVPSQPEFNTRQFRHRH